jgi:hypothetical protein
VVVAVGGLDGLNFTYYCIAIVYFESFFLFE